MPNSSAWTTTIYVIRRYDQATVSLTVVDEDDLQKALTLQRAGLHPTNPLAPNPDFL